MGDVNRDDDGEREQVRRQVSLLLVPLVGIAAGAIRTRLFTADMDGVTRKPAKQYQSRRIAIKLLYQGWDYEGLVRQETTDKTIEHHLFHALLLTHMIADRDTCNYQRSGRTDIAVSAFCQVVSLDVRSSGQEEELNYPFLLNKVLPASIRCICWSPVPDHFSARFSCRQRSYKYFFPRSSLHVHEMREAAHHLIGEQDFRNFCKLDANNHSQTMRHILSADIHVVDSDSRKGEKGEKEEGDNVSPYDVLCVTITGSGFLWHQIRCILSLLFLVGEGKESPDIVKDLLDLNKFPFKPQYQLASGLPLVLYDCVYADEDVEWIVDYKTLSEVMTSLQGQWTQLTIKATMIANMMRDIRCLHPHLSAIHRQHDCLSNEKSKKHHKRICDRPVSTKYPAANGRDLHQNE